jgi:hypothetical protein
MLYCIVCNRPAIWGAPVGRATHCTRHRRLGSRRKETCGAPQCELWPTYNYADRPGLQHCARHKLMGCRYAHRQKCVCGRRRSGRMCGPCRRRRDGTSTVKDINRAIRGLQAFLQEQAALRG